MICRYVVSDVHRALAAIPDGTVDLVMTSPPFLALRSYLPDDHPDKAQEIGSEATPAEFVSTLLGLSAEWRRVLAPHGSIAIELGDTYSGSGGAGGDYADGGLRDGQSAFAGSARKKTASRRRDREHVPHHAAGGHGWPEAKSLSLIPEAYRLALAYGLHPLTGEVSPAGLWRVRNVVDWCRPNPPVAALGDKFRPSTSDLVIACTARDRWFDMDAVRSPSPRVDNRRTRSTPYAAPGQPERRTRATDHSNPAGAPPLDHWDLIEHLLLSAPDGATDRERARHVRDRLADIYGPSDHWKISPGGYAGAHYAVYPPELCRVPIETMCPRRVCRTCGAPSRRLVKRDEDAIAKTSRPVKANSGGRRAKAGRLSPQETSGMHVDRTISHTVGWTTCGCPGTDGVRLDGWHRGDGWRPGLVLDPFGGSGTTGLVATGLSRDALLIDIDARNVDLARERLGMLLEEIGLDQLDRTGEAA